MQNLNILVIGGGIGGLTSAIALRRAGHRVEVIEKDPDWSVYGVGIIQQSNVVRAMDQLGLLDDYVAAGFGFDQVEVFRPDGVKAATIPSPRLVEHHPANIGIGRRALHKVLGDRARDAGATIRLGVTAIGFDDREDGLTVTFSDRSEGRYDLAIGADGLYSATRTAIFPDAPEPEFTGQSVWRYNFERTADVGSLQAYEGPIGVGLVPLSDCLMYMYVTTPEPGNPRYPRAGLAREMRSRLVGQPAAIASLAERITEDDEVVYKPLEWVFLEGAWHKGRVVLLGDAVHATTPHLGQGGGMAIEDSVVLAEELTRGKTIEAAFGAYRARRFERCRYVVERSRALSYSQTGQGPLVEQGRETHLMTQFVAAPI